MFVYIKNLSQAYLVWAPKLDALKIGIPLSKQTWKTPCKPVSWKLQVCLIMCYNLLVDTKRYSFEPCVQKLPPGVFCKKMCF